MGLAAAADIAAVEGVDMLFFGPSDYCADAGLNFVDDAEAVWAAWEKMNAAARSVGKGVMGFPWPGADPKRLTEAGCESVTVASDVVALTTALKQAVEEQ